MDRKHIFNIGYLIVALVLLSLFQMWLAWRDVVQLSLTEPKQLVGQAKVASVTLTETTL